MPGARSSPLLLRPTFSRSRLIEPKGLQRSCLGCSPARRDGGVPRKRSRWLRIRKPLAPSGPGPQSLAPEPQGAGALRPGPEGAVIGRAFFAPGPRPGGAGPFCLRSQGRRARAWARGAGSQKKKGPAPGFREGYRNLPLGPGRRGADLKSAILGPPNAPPTVLTATWRIAQAQIVSSEPWEGGGGRAESEMLLISWKNAPISQIKTPGLPDNKHR